jgi:polyisoprenoid-binding protein YceI
MRSIFALAALLALGTGVPSYASDWKIDPAHSTASFSVRHMMISNVNGQFSKVTGTVEYDAKSPKNTKIDATIDATTVNTNESSRDKHLKGPDFFDVEKFPTMTFKSKKIVSASKGKMKVLGDLTLHGVTKEVTLNVVGPSAEIKDPRGQIRIGAAASAVINRKDFGITYNKTLDNGGVAVGEQVPITIDIELSKQAKVADAN